jgi:hypothetical protein
MKRPSHLDLDPEFRGDRLDPAALLHLLARADPRWLHPFYPRYVIQEVFPYGNRKRQPDFPAFLDKPSAEKIVDSKRGRESLPRVVRHYLKPETF